MSRENRGAFLRSLGRIFGNVLVPAVEPAGGELQALGLARLNPTALLAVAATVMLGVVLAVGVMLAMMLVRSTDRGLAGASFDRPAGTVVTGRVLDGDNRPIAGARVTSGTDRSREPIAEATTDAQGWYTIHDVPNGKWILTVQARGHAPSFSELTIEREPPFIEFRLGPAQCIRGRVVDIHDEPIAGAPVAVEDWCGHHSLKWSTQTDAEGRFRWDEAPYGIVLIAVGPLGDDPGKRYCRMTPACVERTIVMREPLHIQGSVVDADSGQPITSFTVIPGYAWGSGDLPIWESDRAQEVTGASYDITLDTIYPRHFLRVRADGHRDGVSHGFLADEDSTEYVFKLPRANWTEGIVRLPDRSPLSGAEVHLVSPTHPLDMHDDWLPGSWYQLPVRTRTGPDGRFRFERQEPPYTILVTHERGCVEQTIKNRPPGVFDLTIQPWGRIEGTLRIGNRPGAREKIHVFHEHPGEPPNAVPSWTRVTTTDDAGRFVLDRIRPGPAHIARVVEVRTSPDSWILCPTIVAPIEVAPGEITRVDLGGTGRPVTGKLTAPAELAGRVNWLRSHNSLTAQPAPADRLSAAIEDPNRAGGGPSARQPWSVVLDRDGSFRIEDVPAGSYDLNFAVLQPLLDGSGRPTDRAMATAHREVTVPEMPGGRSDEPLDLGTIPLVPAQGP